MPISISEIKNATLIQKASGISLQEARRLGKKTAFLCHSHKDVDLVQGVEALLHKSGWDVYIDWKDLSMPETPDRNTANRIKQKIVELDYFLFLATENSTKSRWCPWEIGFADGEKHIERILIIPTKDDSSGKTNGNEYLDLYNKIDTVSGSDLAIWNPNRYQYSSLLRSM